MSKQEQYIFPEGVKEDTEVLVEVWNTRQNKTEYRHGVLLGYRKSFPCDSFTYRCNIKLSSGIELTGRKAASPECVHLIQNK